MTYGFALQIVLILVVVSGIISFIGNYVGRFFGKKRLSLFGLRPRYTAVIFTLISGILIALVTFATVVLISFDARTAFFGLEKLRAQISQAQIDLKTAKDALVKESEKLEKSVKELEKNKKELDSTKAEIRDLLATRENLKKEVEMALSRRVVFTSGDVIYSLLIKGAQGKEAAESELNRIIKYLNEEFKKYSAKEIQYEKSDFDSTVSYMANMDSGIILRVIADRNLAAGGTPVVHFEVQVNQLLYRKGEEIGHAAISGKLTASETEQRLKDLLAKVRDDAKKKGVLYDFPGYKDSYPYAEIYEAVRRIRGYGTMTRVFVLAASDIYTVGPLDVEFKVQP